MNHSASQTSPVTTPTTAPPEQDKRPHAALQWWRMLPFVAIHLGALIGLLGFFSWPALVLAIGLYIIRMFAVTAGYHRYFSHRTFKTSRAFQLLLAFLAQTSAQLGTLSWAARHRWHHSCSDQAGDVHSPVVSGFWYAHVLWMYQPDNKPDFKRIRDMARYPELRFLEQWALLPAVILGVICFIAMGWPGLLVGFFFSTVVLWHGTFTINSLAHLWGSRRYQTADTSRNNVWLALITLGEGWHNNHHHFPSCARQGHRWWEIDPTYYLLRLLAAFGIIWDIKEYRAAARRS